MPTSKGLLLVTMEPPPAMEEEFNDWYDSEHVPERAAIPGFLTARRFVCVSGWPRYLALYDLETLAALDSKEYAAVSGDRFSPWSKRVLNRVRGQCRMAAEQLDPGAGTTGPLARLLFLRFSGLADAQAQELAGAVRAAFGQRPAVTQVRLFREPTAEGTRFLVLAEAVEPFPQLELASGLGRFAKALDIVNEYAPYWTRGPLHGVYEKH